MPAHARQDSVRSCSCLYHAHNSPKRGAAAVVAAWTEARCSSSLGSLLMCIDRLQMRWRQQQLVLAPADRRVAPGPAALSQWTWLMMTWQH
jgi:hypothetical protein